MRGLTDLRVLILIDPRKERIAQSDLDLLAQRTTAHVLPVTRATFPLTALRVLKRLLLRQDDLLVLYGLPSLLRIMIAGLGRLWRRPVVPVRVSGGPRGQNLLRVLAQRVGRPWSVAALPTLRLDVGCGSQVRPGFLGIDARRTVATALVADARALAVQNHVADEVYASCLLEHFDDPHQVLREIHRVLRSDGQAVLRLPNLGTYSSHLDTTHRFLADLALWRQIFSGYFTQVRVVPVGTKYRDNPWLVRVNWLLVHILGWYELAQGWDFICTGPKALPSVEYTGWWEE